MSRRYAEWFSDEELKELIHLKRITGGRRDRQSLHLNHIDENVYENT